MKTFGIISYNKYANFTNYGSALQSWALNTVINKVGESIGCRAMFVDYCPDILAKLDPLNPFKNMWDQDMEARKRVEFSMLAIRENYEKFMMFYDKRFFHTKEKYTSQNFNTICERENIDGFVCGSDTIFCYKEFGFDDGYFANYDVMREGYSVAYAASFGDTDFDKIDKKVLKAKLRNFRYLALRESQFLDFAREATGVAVEQVIDPTLLLTADDYDTILASRQIDEPYVLLYSRRYNPIMAAYADRLLADLDKLDWPEKVKKMQAEWIGKSHGAEVNFKVDGRDDEITVYTTRPDTLHGATFMVLAPEHELAKELATDETREAVEEYIYQASLKSSVDRMQDKEKTGVFTGSYAINPINGAKVPIWLSD